MSDTPDRLSAALADRYRIERDGHGGPSLLGQGGIATELVTEVTARLKSLKRLALGFRGHFSDPSRALKDSLAPGSRWCAPKGRSGDATGNPDV